MIGYPDGRVRERTEREGVIIEVNRIWRGEASTQTPEDIIKQLQKSTFHALFLSLDSKYGSLTVEFEDFFHSKSPRSVKARDASI